MSFSFPYSKSFLFSHFSPSLTRHPSLDTPRDGSVVLEMAREWTNERLNQGINLMENGGSGTKVYLPARNTELTAQNGQGKEGLGKMNGGNGWARMGTGKNIRGGGIGQGMAKESMNRQKHEQEVEANEVSISSGKVKNLGNEQDGNSGVEVHANSTQGAGVSPAVTESKGSSPAEGGKWISGRLAALKAGTAVVSATLPSAKSYVSQKGHNSDGNFAVEKKFAEAKVQSVDLVEWFYRDPNGVAQGPFAKSQMQAWFKADYFQLTLPVRRGFTGPFVALGAWFADGSPAFLDFLPIHRENEYLLYAAKPTAVLNLPIAGSLDSGSAWNAFPPSSISNNSVHHPSFVANLSQPSHINPALGDPATRVSLPDLSASLAYQQQLTQQQHLLHQQFLAQQFQQQQNLQLGSQLLSQQPQYPMVSGIQPSLANLTPQQILALQQQLHQQQILHQMSALQLQLKQPDVSAFAGSNSLNPNLTPQFNIPLSDSNLNFKNQPANIVVNSQNIEPTAASLPVASTSVNITRVDEHVNKVADAPSSHFDVSSQQHASLIQQATAIGKANQTSVVKKSELSGPVDVEKQVKPAPWGNVKQQKISLAQIQQREEIESMQADYQRASVALTEAQQQPAWKAVSISEPILYSKEVRKQGVVEVPIVSTNEFPALDAAKSTRGQENHVSAPTAQAKQVHAAPIIWSTTGVNTKNLREIQKEELNQAKKAEVEARTFVKEQAAAAPKSVWGNVKQTVPKVDLRSIQELEAKSVQTISVNAMPLNTGPKTAAQIVAGRTASVASNVNIAAFVAPKGNETTAALAKSAPTSVSKFSNQSAVEPKPVSLNQDLGDELFWSNKPEPAANSILPEAAPKKGNTTNAFGGPALSGEMETWCKKEMAKITGNEDTTLVNFLITLDQPAQIKEYCYTYLGSSASVDNFCESFITQREFLLGREQKTAAIASSNALTTVVSKKKKNK